MINLTNIYCYFCALNRNCRNMFFSCRISSIWNKCLHLFPAAYNRHSRIVYHFD